jgi:hypothetical protein
VDDFPVLADSNGDRSLASPTTGPFLYTFTARLPFVLGVSDGLDHQVDLHVRYASQADDEVFQRGPFVRVRMFNAPIADRKFCFANMPEVVHHFYGAEYPFGEADGTHLYEQWISLETPAVFLEGEKASDPAYAFHRCLSVLNLFLQAFALARDDDRVRPISSRELRPVVVVGELDLSGSWRLQQSMLMHPDAKERQLSTRSAAEHTDALNAAMGRLLSSEPFIRTGQWRMRAERRKYEGDAADSVISFQTAAETLAYELWTLLLADEGLTEQEVKTRQVAGIHFKSLLIRELGPRLGGAWDLSSQRSPVGQYWNRLYVLRNRIVHSGYLAHDSDAANAEAAFAAFDTFLDGQLRSKAKQFPIAARAKLEGQRPRT